jgi:hypothetical protein
VLALALLAVAFEASETELRLPTAIAPVSASNCAHRKEIDRWVYVEKNQAIVSSKAENDILWMNFRLVFFACLSRLSRPSPSPKKINI